MVKVILNFPTVFSAHAEVVPQPMANDRRYQRILRACGGSSY